MGKIYKAGKSWISPGNYCRQKVLHSVVTLFKKSLFSMTYVLRSTLIMTLEKHYLYSYVTNIQGKIKWI